MLKGEISHEHVQRFLAGERQTSADLWQVGKVHVRKIESEDGMLIVEDSILEKHYTDENEIICWHFDHSLQRTVKGVNFVVACSIMRVCLWQLELSGSPILNTSMIKRMAKKNDVQRRPGMNTIMKWSNRLFVIRYFSNMYSTMCGFPAQIT